MPSKRWEIAWIPSSEISGWTTNVNSYSRTIPPGRRPIGSGGRALCGPRSEEEQPTAGRSGAVLVALPRGCDQRGVDAGVAGELGVEGGGPDVSLPHRDRPAVVAREDLHVRAGAAQPRRADEHAGHSGPGTVLGGGRERVDLRAVGVSHRDDV